MSDSYKTLKKYSSDEFVEKRSRFIGYAMPVTSEDQAIDFINKIKKLDVEIKKYLHFGKNYSIMLML